MMNVNRILKIRRFHTDCNQRQRTDVWLWRGLDIKDSADFWAAYRRDKPLSGCAKQLVQLFRDLFEAELGRTKLINELKSFVKIYRMCTAMC